MDKLETTRAKRTQKYYTLGFKLAVVDSKRRYHLTESSSQDTRYHLAES